MAMSNLLLITMTIFVLTIVTDFGSASLCVEEHPQTAVCRADFGKNFLILCKMFFSFNKFICLSQKHWWLHESLAKSKIVFYTNFALFKLNIK